MISPPPQPRAERDDMSVPASERWRSLVISLVGLLAIVLIGTLMIVTQRHDEQVLRSLPPDARAHVFLRSLTEVRTICRESYAAAGPLHDHCVAQARFILLFPDCDSGCRTAAHAILPQAYR